MSEDDFSNEERLEQFQPGVVSGLQQCQSSEVKKLCIFDIGNKLSKSDKYDIGTTYTESEPDLSFYFTTNNFHTNRYLLNLFVCHHTIGSFKIKISDYELLHTKNKEGKTKSQLTSLKFPGALNSKAFTSSEENESHYIRSFYFPKSDIEKIKNLYIPIAVEMNINYIINEEVLTWVKEKHNNSIFQMKENTDFTIVSSSGKKYDTHKLLLAIHSCVLKEEIKKNKTNLINLDIDDEEMNLLLEFLYKNTICDINNSNWHQILDLSEKLDINSLRELIQKPIWQQISVDNAVSIAILSEKYKLLDIQTKIIDFIKSNPEVLDTDSWNSLNDVVLTKKLLKGICISSK